MTAGTWWMMTINFLSCFDMMMHNYYDADDDDGDNDGDSSGRLREGDNDGEWRWRWFKLTREGARHINATFNPNLFS